MLQRDYLLRLIAAIGRILARAVGLKTAGKLDEAQQVLREEAGRLLGLDPRLLELIDPPTIPDLFRSGDDFDAAHCLGAAELLRESGEILALQGREADAQDRRVRALACFLAVFRHPDGNPTPDVAEKIERLAGAIEPGALPALLTDQLAAFHQQR